MQELKKFTRQTSVDLDAFRQLHGKGLTDAELAAAFKISERWAAALRRRMNLSSNGKMAAVRARDQKMQQLYDQGLFDEDIASALECSAVAVRDWRLKNGLPSKQAFAALEQRRLRHQKMAELYERGMSDKEISAELNIPQSTVCHWRIESGLAANVKRWDVARGTHLKTPLPVTPDRFFMTDQEILRSWRMAEDRKAQVGILAQLNACSKKRMLEKLESLDVDLSCLD